MMSCSVKDRKGFNLQKFIIVNDELQKIVNDLTQTINLEGPASVYTLMLELREYKSNPEFWFILSMKENVVSKIFSENKRIVGYITDNNKDIIVISNINDRFDFEVIFYKFIHPAEDSKKRFDFVYFSEYQYRADERGNPLIPPSVRYYYWAYVFQDNKLIIMEDEEWYKERMSH